MTQQPGYGYDSTPQQHQRPTETMAVLALVFAFVFPLLGIVFGVVARKNIRQNGNNGQGLATAGFWIGIVFTSLGVLGVIAYVVLIAALVGSGASTAP